MIARRLGRSVLLLERGKHPRVVIGESTTPLTNLYLEELAARYDLPRITPLAKYGTWQQSYPHLACGLKRGFTFYHHDLAHPIGDEPGRDHELLVAASPHDRIADTHWYRADVDSELVRQAQELGVEYLDEVQLCCAREVDEYIQLEGVHNGERVAYNARFVIDATGPRGFLHRAFGLSEAELPGFPGTQALYNHFRGVGRFEPRQGADKPPYPPDDAAVHHVFDGGWIWVLRFNNGVTSAGVCATEERAQSLNLREGGPAWARLVSKIPFLEPQFRGATTERPFTYLRRLSFRSATIAGSRWALMPSAAGFVDPLLSTGFPLALLGIGRLAEIIRNDWGSIRFAHALQNYAAHTEGELLAAARLVSSLYANMGNFPVFVSVSLLYFAAVSYSEVIKRLGNPAPPFLLYDDPRFGPVCRQLLERAHHVRRPCEAEDFRQDVLRAIDPFDLAGLSDTRRRNWYPVQADDLFQSAGKAGAGRGAIAKLLERSGFWEPNAPR